MRRLFLFSCAGVRTEGLVWLTLDECGPTLTPARRATKLPTLPRITILFPTSCNTVTQAQATRTWVSGVGDDFNPCSRTGRCKTYAGAFSKTAKDGEISTLDPGGFGTLTITKSITINGGGAGQGYGSVLSALAPQGFLINITDPADVRKTVRLNWLDINGASTGTDGVRMIAGNALHIENTYIDGLVGDGVEVNIAGANVAELYMRNVSIRNCVGNGIITTASNASGLVASSIENVSVTNYGDGFEAGARSLATLTHASSRPTTAPARREPRCRGNQPGDEDLEKPTYEYSPQNLRCILRTQAKFLISCSPPPRS